MKKLIPFLMIAAIGCNQKQAEGPRDSVEVAYTKTMVYAVDLNSMFHEDLNDEDFSDAGPITEKLIGDVLSGKLKAYYAFSDEPITAEQAKSVLVFTDTIWFNNPETGDQSIDIVDRDYTAEFYGLTFKEKWSYDSEQSVIDRKIVGLAPRIPVYSRQGGELRGYTSAFWVKYE
jgi:hypothetical protein